MKKLIIVAILCAVLPLTGIVGCSNDQKKQQPFPKVGVSFSSQREERWVRDRAKMEQVCADLGLELVLKVAENDPDRQEKQCDTLIAQGAKVLIVAPQDSKASAAIVDKAHRSGAKVIAYDRMILGADVDLYVSFDNVKVGELQGQALTRLVPKGVYVVMSGSPDDNNAAQFRAGAMKYLQPLIDKKDIAVAVDRSIKDWNPAEAQKVIAEALTSNSHIDAILAPNDGIAGACIAELETRNLAGKIPVTGQDADVAAARRIAKGTQSMTVYKNTRKLGAVAVQAALAMIMGQPLAMINGKVNNGKMDVPAILCDPMAVDKSNLDSALITSDYLKREDVYK